MSEEKKYLEKIEKLVKQFIKNGSEQDAVKTDKTTIIPDKRETHLVYDAIKCDELLEYRQMICNTPPDSDNNSNKDHLRVNIVENSIKGYIKDAFTEEILPQKEFQTLLKGQIGDELVFTSKGVFDTIALRQIRKTYMPNDANAYSSECKDNVLRMRFYTISR